ncbi:MAG: phage tail protein [Cyanobacteria bacterium RUI128]|nr:phage tail protein [Cyanobacteria bacterium RUI128]
MSLIEIEYGSLASSGVLNDNFNYLKTEVEALADNINQKTSFFSSQVATLNTSVTDLLSYRSSFIDTGMIIPCILSVVPDGFLLCDGSELEIEDYGDLYDVIGTAYGSSDASSFCLPDLTDKTLWGEGSSSVGEYVDSKLPNIKGQFRLQGTEGSSAVSGAFVAGSRGGSWGTGHDNSAKNPLMQFDASRYSEVYDDECDVVQPPALVVKFIIKY